MIRFPLLLAAAGSLALVACADSSDVDEAPPVDTAADQTAVAEDATLVGDIPGALGSDVRFSTLASAVNAADMTETLRGEGPYTVFAPSNAAFDKLPDETRMRLLGDTEADGAAEGTMGTRIGDQEENRSGGQIGRQSGTEVTGDSEALRAILAHHVIEGRIDSETLTRAVEAAGPQGHVITTLGGGRLTARELGDGIRITDGAGNTATIVTTDIASDNGLIHEIDAVLLPE